MKTEIYSEDEIELKVLCRKIKELVKASDYQKCETIISEAMGKYPHAPEPHNLIGVLLEKQGNHVAAMKHFRAAWALDPTYLPARQNLNLFGTFFSYGEAAFEESDCTEEKFDEYKMERDAHGISHVIRRQ